MNCKTLLVGISVAALAAGSASAQTNNTSTELCSPLSICDVDNNVAGNDRNDGQLRVTGTGNSAFIVQRGDDNRSTGEINGDDNSLYHEQNGDDHVSESFVTGDDNVTTIYQGTEANAASVRQNGNLNSSYIDQGDISSGENNAATVTQTGSNLGSTILQYGTSGTQGGDSNSATVSQTGTGSDATIEQRAAGATAVVTMLEGGANNATGDRRNTANVVQENTIFTTGAGGALVTTGGAPSATNNPTTNNVADIAIRGQQNTGNVFQNGVNLEGVISMTAGGPGNTGATPINGPDGTPLPANRIQGNQGTIQQIGRGHSAELSIGGSAVFNGQGNITNVTQQGTAATGHTATVFQRGTLENVQISQDNNALGGAGGASTQTGSIADVSQLSINSEAFVTQVGSNTAIVTQGRNANQGGGDNLVVINQTDAGDIVTNPSDPFGGGGSVTAARNTTEVAQYGISNVIDVEQNARNARATVFQTQGSLDNNVDVNQTGGNPTLNVTTTVNQTGTRSNATVNQTGTNGTVSVAQTGTVYAGGTLPNVANVTQSGNWNNANVSQNGNRLTATVNQAGANGTAARPNLITITQTTNTNTATATQTAGVGASGATAPAAGVPGNAAFPNSRPAGAASAEIRITQSNTGNTASVTQAGLGQYGEINQSGTGNTGTIDQQAGATNAVAIIEQSGNANTYTITQTQPGQYFRVTQSGNGNAVNNTITSGPGGGGTGAN